jgi:hypothetical protein
MCATPVEGQSAYIVDEAAAILRETPERVRDMLATGELESIPPGANVSGEWKVLMPATFLEDRDRPVEETPSSPQKEASSAEAEPTVLLAQPPERGLSRPAHRLYALLGA